MTKITKYKVTATIPAGETTATAYSIPIRGRIIAVGINYPANTCTVDLDSDGEASAQKVLNLAAANTDITYYPRTPVQDVLGADVTYDGTNEIYEPFLVYGRIKLSLASGTATQAVTVYLMVEEQ